MTFVLCSLCLCCCSRCRGGRCCRSRSGSRSGRSGSRSGSRSRSSRSSSCCGGSGACSGTSAADKGLSMFVWIGTSFDTREFMNPVNVLCHSCVNTWSFVLNTTVVEILNLFTHVTTANAPRNKTIHDPFSVVTHLTRHWATRVSLTCICEPLFMTSAYHVIIEQFS